RLANDLDRALDLARDPREAAQQLARLQEGVRQRLAEEVNKGPRETPVPLEERIKDLLREQEAIQRAAAALPVPEANKNAARPQDVEPSQQQARRALERLEQALAGKKPADEQAQELARRQKELAAEAARLAAGPKATTEQQKNLQRRQEEIARETQDLQTPE